MFTNIVPGHIAIKNTLDFYEFTDKVISLKKFIFKKNFKNSLKHCTVFIF